MSDIDTDYVRELNKHTQVTYPCPVKPDDEMCDEDCPYCFGCGYDWPRLMARVRWLEGSFALMSAIVDEGPAHFDPAHKCAARKRNESDGHTL